MLREKVFNLLLEAQGSIRPEHHPNVLTYKILSLLHSEIEKAELSDEEIYRLNEADTEMRRHHFWESGLLDTCKAATKAQIQAILKAVE